MELEEKKKQKQRKQRETRNKVYADIPGYLWNK